jgi:hypothetical protein
MRGRQRTISIPQWATLLGLADDDRSIEMARALIAEGTGPLTVQVRQRKRTKSGVRLRDYQDWLGQNEWAKFLAAEAARNRRK